ncbi:MAG: anticodon nuclease [Bacteroidales bacterium]|nr:anticodon nuclease [Bacteroidales bacterium]
MTDKPKIYKYKTLKNVATKIKDDLSSSDVVLLYAFNRTGKTRLSTEFKDFNKRKYKSGNTLYFNAYTEDLFTWDNDLDKNKIRNLHINQYSKFVKGLKGLSLEERIHTHFERYAQIKFRIDYDKWIVIFSKEIPNPKFNSHNNEPERIIEDNIKISRGEENIFIFSLFLSICELALEGHEEYDWVKNIYVDDPISSLDENNAITVAADLSSMIKTYIDQNRDNSNSIKFVISSHHSLFYNVVYNELHTKKCKSYFLHKTAAEEYRLQSTNDTPFFHHIEQLCELNSVVEKYKKAEEPNAKIYQSNILKTYHFNILRSIFEKTAIFFGHDNFSYCLKDIEDADLYARAVNIMSHGKYSIFSPVGMLRENAELFVKIFTSFVTKYKFELPDIFFDNTDNP